MRTATVGFRGVALSVVVVVLLLLSSAAWAAAPQGGVQRVNVAYDGGLANNEGQGGLAVSADGRYVAFVSSASNIIEGDTNGRYDVFVRDMESQETTLVSVTTGGEFGTGGAINYVDMTPDGRYVLFASSDTELVPGDTNGYPDVFRRDMVSQETTRVSTTADGTQANFYCSSDSSISDDGRFIVFGTIASNLFPGDSNSRQDCVLKDMQSGVITNVSYTSAGGLGNEASFYPVISGDGSKVAFVSYATNMVPGDVRNLANLFIRDLGTGDIERVDATTLGGESLTEVDIAPCDLDHTGRRVAFASRQTDIVDVPVGVFSQIYLRDTQSDETTVVARTIDGNVANDQCNYPNISSDGRWISFVGGASNLVVNDTNAAYDVFVRDMNANTIERLNYNENGEQLNAGTYEQRVCADATVVVFNSWATNIIEPYAPGGIGHIYLRDLRDLNTPPVALADSHTTAEDTQLAVAAPGVLANDTDADGDSLEAATVAGPLNGSLSLNPNGSFTYEPDSGYSGPDSFTYHANDGDLDSNTVTVTITVTPVDEEVSYIPIAGSNRYTTGVEASKAAFDSAGTVVIATGENWPDALGGAALSGVVDGPLLLTKPTALSTAVKDEIARLGATSAYILGGTGAVSPSVEAELNGLLAGTVTRLQGSNRYATARAVADRVIALQGASYTGEAFVSTGDNFPDALGASPLSAAWGVPILLTKTDQMPSLPARVDSVTILGGTSVVTSKTEILLNTALGATDVDRIGGSNRYDTAAQVADYGVDGGMHWDGVGIATGLEFPDALSGGAMLGSMESVMLLTKSTSLVSQAEDRLDANKDDIDTVHFIGGTNAVSQGVRDKVAQVLE